MLGDPRFERWRKLEERGLQRKQYSERAFGKYRGTKRKIRKNKYH